MAGKTCEYVIEYPDKLCDVVAPWMIDWPADDGEEKWYCAYHYDYIVHNAKKLMCEDDSQFVRDTVKRNGW